MQEKEGKRVRHNGVLYQPPHAIKRPPVQYEENYCSSMSKTRFNLVLKKIYIDMNIYIFSIAYVCFFSFPTIIDFLPNPHKKVLKLHEFYKVSLIKYKKKIFFFNYRSFLTIIFIRFDVSYKKFKSRTVAQKSGNEQK